MTMSFRWVLAAGLFVTISGCGSATARSAPGPIEPGTGVQTPPRTPAEQARADGGRPAYTAADVRFMQGMIAHHAQAVVMAGWAATHAAGSDVQTLAGRILVAQQDEIALMQRWLRERGETVPDSGTPHDMAGHHMPDAGVAASGARAPGMLTPEQLARLGAARGAAFDSLFLTFMIEHHEGAITMVRQLFATPGAGQDLQVFQIASDVEADQTTEIERMQGMLSRRRPSSGTP